MKILFLIGATSRVRNFEHVIEWLAGRGHTLQLAGRPRKGSFALPKTFKVGGVTARENPTKRTDEWRDLVDGLRGARDYVRYLAPEYASAARLVRRAYEISPTGFVLFCERYPWVKRHWRTMASALAYAETLVPTDPGCEQFVREEQPDLVVVTPLVTFESYQTDYVKAAHRLGIPIAFLPFSWDNLTNKGLMRVCPDRVFVWNEVQKREAIELHGAPPASVVVTGAPRFDDFFARVPSTSREAFCGSYGLDPQRPMLLFLGSSQLTGPNELELVRRWAESLRGAQDATIRECSILVRPHPALKTSWSTVDLSDLGNIAISLEASRGADQELFDSLYHSHAAVGLNTSAMLEAAIVGRPVFTLLIPGFEEGQVGTIHFRYLVDAFGGLVTIARSFAEHHGHISPLLDSPPAVSDRSRRFAERFLRPHGLDLPASSILAQELENTAAIQKQSASLTPPWHYPLRAALRTFLNRQHTTVVSRGNEDTSPVATSMSLRPVKTALEELRQETGPIFIGPWLDSVANELLYWIPFVRWAVETYGLASDRLVVLSQGSREWYGSLAPKYLEPSGLFRDQDFANWCKRTIPQREQNPKQAVLSPMDQEILQRAASVMDVSEYQSLHPLMFFRVMKRLDGNRELHRLREVLRHERGVVSERPNVGQFRGDYIAVSRDFTEALPENAANAQFLTRALGRLGQDHQLVDVGSTPSVTTQTQVIARAQAFVGGYGDLAVLSAFHGVPTYAFCSSEIPPDQLSLTAALSAEGAWAPISVQRIEHAERFCLPPQAIA